METGWFCWVEVDISVCREWVIVREWQNADFVSG